MSAPRAVALLAECAQPMFGIATAPLDALSELPLDPRSAVASSSTSVPFAWLAAVAQPIFDSALVDILRITLTVALGSTLLVALPGIALGWVLARREFVGKTFVETFVAIPLVLPPTAIGYLLLVLFSRSGPLGERALGFDPGVLFTLRGAVLASAVMALPLVARTARAAFEGVDPRLERMAHSLGHSNARAFVLVTLPLARRGLAAALALGFGRALGEFGATVIVAGNIPGRTQTLALAIFNDIQLGDTRHALWLVAFTVVFAFVLLAWIERLLRVPARSPEPA
jgi:molybdate transport system permease protein